MCILIDLLDVLLNLIVENIFYEFLLEVGVVVFNIGDWFIGERFILEVLEVEEMFNCDMLFLFVG